MIIASNTDALDQLRAQYPWPIKRPDFDSVPWSLDGGGRWLVKSKIKQKKIQVVVEIGCFLGGSILNWLGSSPTVTVVAVDPWPESWNVAQYARDHGKSERVAQQFERPNGFYQTFLANLWNERDRVIPVREYSPAALHQLAATGLRPDLIYLDADKVGGEIELCHELFPGAIMTGDDWGWTDSDGVCSIRRPVIEHCEKHAKHLKVEGATWVIDTERPSLGFRLRTFRRMLQAKLKERRAA